MKREVDVPVAKRSAKVGRPRKDLAGQVFGKLTVLGRLKKQNKGTWYWHCQCACGKKPTIAHSNLAGGKQKHCGRDCKVRQVVRTTGRKFPTRKRLTPEEVTSIKDGYDLGTISQRELGEQYGVSTQTIFKVVNDRTHQERSGPIRRRRATKKPRKSQ